MLYYDETIRAMYEKYSCTKGAYLVHIFDNGSATSYTFTTSKPKLQALAAEYFGQMNHNKKLMVVRHHNTGKDSSTYAYAYQPDTGKLPMLIVVSSTDMRRTVSKDIGINFGVCDLFDRDNPPDIHNAYKSYIENLMAVRSGDIRVADIFTSYRNLIHKADMLYT